MSHSLPAVRNATALEPAKADSVESLCLALDATLELAIARNATALELVGERTKLVLNANKEKNYKTKAAAAPWVTDYDFHTF